MRAVSNTSPIANLAYIGRLDLIREQFGDVSVPEVVWTELSNVPDTGVRRTIEKARETIKSSPKAANRPTSCPRTVPESYL